MWLVLDSFGAVIGSIYRRASGGIKNRVREGNFGRGRFGTSQKNGARWPAAGCASKRELRRQAREQTIVFSVI
jgi:hypothetical protein